MAWLMQYKWCAQYCGMSVWLEFLSLIMARCSGKDDPENILFTDKMDCLLLISRPVGRWTVRTCNAVWLLVFTLAGWYMAGCGIYFGRSLLGTHHNGPQYA